MIDTAFSLNRATGAATVKDIATGNVTTTGTIVASSTVTAAQSFISSTTTAILGTTGAGSVGLRPNGAASSTGQFLVQSTGDVTAAGSVTATTNVISPLVSTYTGTVGTQQIWRNMGWNNGVARWREVIEPDAGYSLYRYDAVGGSALRVFNINIGTGMVSAIDFTATSDIRLKEDVTPLERGLAELKHMPPIAYELHGKRYVGFSAQDVLKFLPEAVGETPDGYMTVSHQQLSALIASAVL